MAITQDVPQDDAGTKVWLITGTSSGMGRSLVKAALERNDKVIATARVLEQIQDLRTLADSSRLYLMQLDITDSQEVINSKVTEAIDVWGRIDVLVNNAGTGVKMILEEGGVEGIIRQFKTNVFGVMAVTYAVLPHMRRRESGTIVITGSRSAFANEFPSVGTYAASKAAVHTLGESLATELRPFSIRVLILQPGSFRTDCIMYPNFAEKKIKDYQEVDQKTRAYFGTLNGKQPNDPDRGMDIVVDVVRGEGRAAGKPFPLWLALGADAVRDIRAKTNRIIESLDVYQDLSVAVGYDEP